MSFDRIAAALPAAVGKTLSGVFLAEYARERWRMVLCFADGTSYEVYGTGTLAGSRGIERGGVDEIRGRLMDDAAVRVVEVSAETIARSGKGRG